MYTIHIYTYILYNVILYIIHILCMCNIHITMYNTYYI